MDTVLSYFGETKEVNKLHRALAYINNRAAYWDEYGFTLKEFKCNLKPQSKNTYIIIMEFSRKA